MKACSIKGIKEFEIKERLSQLTECSEKKWGKMEEMIIYKNFL